MKKILTAMFVLLCGAQLIFAQQTTPEEQLVKASSTGDFQTVQTLLATPNIDVNARYNGDTALVNASFEGHLDIVQALLAHPDIKINKTGNLDVTPLIAASMIGDVDIVHELLKHSPKLNKQDSFGYTALMYAAKNGYMGVAMELLPVYGIKVNVSRKLTSRIEDFNAPTALLIAYNTGHRDIAREILKVKPEPNWLDGSTHYYNEEDLDGNTILMLSAKNGDIDIVRYLLKIQREEKHLYERTSPLVNVNHRNHDNETALMLAAKHGQLEVVNELLKEKNIKLNIKNTFNKTAYDLAATQEIKDAIVKHQNISKKTSEALEKQVLEGIEHFQFDK